MKAQIELKDSAEKQVINVNDVDNKAVLMYEDYDSAFNVLTVFDNGIRIKRVADTHETLVMLLNNEPSFVEVNSPDGSLKLDAEVLEFNKNNDIISIAYKIEGELKRITIRYLGDN